MGMRYKQAGVDVEAGYKAVDLIKIEAAKTFNSNVLTDIGGFGGLYSLDPLDAEEPVLVAGADGVGTKLHFAFLADRHDTIGLDCVAMCVNDVICHGARPLFFLDYIATGKMVPEKIALIVKGVSEGCIESGCALIGGETAEMPGFYKEDEYDIAGFAVGLVSRSDIINGTKISNGDIIIGIESSGLHSNGFSLVRKVLTNNNFNINSYSNDLGCKIIDELLKPTRIYVKGILSLLKYYRPKGIAHITGGGFIENIPRMLPVGLTSEIYMGSWPLKPIFKLVSDLGGVEQTEMFNVFNMGIGMVLIVDPDIAGETNKSLLTNGYMSYCIGKIINGESRVEFVT